MGSPCRRRHHLLFPARLRRSTYPAVTWCVLFKLVCVCWVTRCPSLSHSIQLGAAAFTPTVSVSFSTTLLVKKESPKKLKLTAFPLISVRFVLIYLLSELLLCFYNTAFDFFFFKVRGDPDAVHPLWCSALLSQRLYERLPNWRDKAALMCWWDGRNSSLHLRRRSQSKAAMFI